RPNVLLIAMLLNDVEYRPPREPKGLLYPSLMPCEPTSALPMCLPRPSMFALPTLNDAPVKACSTRTRCRVRRSRARPPKLWGLLRQPVVWPGRQPPVNVPSGVTATCLGGTPVRCVPSSSAGATCSCGVAGRIGNVAGSIHSRQRWLADLERNTERHLHNYDSAFGSPA